MTEQITVTGTIGGNTIDGHALECALEQSVCNIGVTGSLTLAPSFTSEVAIWDDIILYFNGVKKLTGYVDSWEARRPPGTYHVRFSDVMKRAQETFIHDEIIPDGEDAGYWIEYFLTQAGLTTNGEQTTGELIGQDHTWQNEYVADIVAELLRIAGNGWAAMADANGIVQVGQIDTFDRASFTVLPITFRRTISDDMIRNKAVVIGADGIYSSGSQANTYIPTGTEWACIAESGAIISQAQADDMRDQLLDFFDEPRELIQIRAEGDASMTAGSAVSYWDTWAMPDSGLALLTSLSHNISPRGYVQDLTLNEQCLLGWTGETLCSHVHTLVSGDHTDTSSFDDSPLVIDAIVDGNNVYVAWSEENYTGTPVPIYFNSSTDGGQTWTWSSGSYLGSKWWMPQMELTSSGSIVLVYNDSDTYGLYAIHSGDGGLTWSSGSRVDDVSTIYPNHSLLQASNGDLHLFWVNDDTYALRHQVSTDEGLTWSSSASFGEYIPDLPMAVAGDIDYEDVAHLAVQYWGDYGEILYYNYDTKDGAVAGPTEIYTGEAGDATLETVDVAVYGPIVCIGYVVDYAGYATYMRISRSTNSGATFTNTDVLHLPYWSNYGGLSMDVSDSGKFYVSLPVGMVGNTRVFWTCSTDGGLTWKPLSWTKPTVYQNSSGYSDLLAHTHLYGTCPRVFMGQDVGSTTLLWIMRNPPFVPVSECTIGTTDIYELPYWQRDYTPQPTAPEAELVLSPDDGNVVGFALDATSNERVMYAVTSGSTVLRMDDQGWHTYNDPGVNGLTDIAVFNGYIYASTSGSGVYVHNPGVLDNFVGAVGATLPNHTPDRDPIGTGWAALEGNWQLNGSGQAYSTYTTNAVAVIDCGEADGTLESEIYLDPTETDALSGITFRATDVNNHWFARFDTSYGGIVTFFKVEGGVWTGIASAYVTFGPPDTLTLKVALSGANIKIYVDDVLKLETDDSFNQTATKHGLWAYRTLCRHNDFEFTSLNAWTRDYNPNQTLNAMTVSGGSVLYAAGTGGFVYYKQGDTWGVQVAALSDTVRSMGVYNDYVWAGLDDGKLYYATSGSDGTWTENEGWKNTVATAGIPTAMAHFGYNAGRWNGLFICGDDGVYKTTDMQFWTKDLSLSAQTPQAIAVGGAGMIGAGYLHVGTNSGNVYSWNYTDWELQDDSLAGTPIVSMGTFDDDYSEASFYSHGTAFNYAGVTSLHPFDGKLRFTTSGSHYVYDKQTGNVTIDTSGPKNIDIGGWYTSGSTLYVAAGENYIYNGTIWTSSGSIVPYVGSISVTSYDGNIYVGGNNGYIYRLDTGASVCSIDSGSPRYMLEFDDYLFIANDSNPNARIYTWDGASTNTVKAYDIVEELAWNGGPYLNFASVRQLVEFGGNIYAFFGYDGIPTGSRVIRTSSGSSPSFETVLSTYTPNVPSGISIAQSGRRLWVCIAGKGFINGTYHHYQHYSATGNSGEWSSLDFYASGDKARDGAWYADKVYWALQENIHENWTGGFGGPLPISWT